MEGFFSGVQFWHWWILAALLAAVEAMLPGIFFIWFGAAAAIVGLIVLILPGMGWELQVVLFAVLAAAGFLRVSSEGTRRFAARPAAGSRCSGR